MLSKETEAPSFLVKFAMVLNNFGEYKYICMFFEYKS